jgi:two-component sensor histidine kinase
MLLMEEVRRLLEVTACSIWLIDSETGELVCRQAIGPHRDTILGWRLSPDQGIAGWVASSGQSVLVNNTTADERHFDGVDRLTGEPLHSILCVPMYAHQDVIGVLQVLDTESDRFTETDQTLQELLATITSIAIENARLHDQVQQDAKTKRLLLTDLNRRISTLLTGIIRLLSTIRRYTRLKKQSDSSALMTNVLARMQGQKRVYAFLAEFEWNPLPLSELILRVIQGTLDALHSEKRITVDISSSPVRVTPEQADSLGMIINELVMNTVKHATIGRKTATITVHIGRIGDSIYIQYRDDGPGWPKDVTRFEQHQTGVYILQKIVRKDLEGKLDLYNEDGAVAEIRCKNLVQSIV